MVCRLDRDGLVGDAWLAPIAVAGYRSFPAGGRESDLFLGAQH